MNVIGNPDSPKNRGRMCAKGKSGIMNHYNRDRVTHPLKRTNPDKGINVDPKWQEISWEEALDTISQKLRKVIEEDPRKLYLQTWGAHDLAAWLSPLTSAVGTPYHQSGLSGTCGKTIHQLNHLTAGGFWDEVDFEYCNYLIDVGTQQGIATREGFNHSVPDCATARERGMKLVVVDPIGNNAAAKANEWLPIRPGTDAAFGLGMLNVLLNEVKIYDREFLKHRTNAVYLVGANGKYVRDAATSKALQYDLSDGVVKTYDDPTLVDPALEGEYEVEGQKARPAFELLKARAAEYPLERVEEITSIPAKKIRRIAQEFGEAAQIGATINIDGQNLPYRPVALNWCRGPQGHKHAWHHTWALQLVNVIMGGINEPGGYQSRATATNWPVKVWPTVEEDGMLGAAHAGNHAAAFPGRPASKPDRCDLFELFPVAAHTRTAVPEVYKDPDKFGIDHKIELVIHTPGNQVMGGWGNVQAVVDWYKGIDLVVGFAVEINETHELDDIILPMPTYLEEDSFGSQDAVCGEVAGFHQIQQKVVEPPEGVRNPIEVLMDLYDRTGILDDVYYVQNMTLGLKPSYLLEAGKRYTAEEVLDRQAKSRYGEEYGWDWFKENGVLVHKRDVDERYPGSFVKGRIPIYMENFITRGEELDAVIGEMNLEWDTSDYQPLPEWKPCQPFEQVQRGEIDAIGVHYKLPHVYGAQGNGNPWVDELCEKLPHSYGVLINAQMARRKGIKDGDQVWLESADKKDKVAARVTQMVHPEVIGIAGHSGHWSAGKPLSRGKGVNFQGLLPYDLDHIDMISSAIDMCAPLKVYKA